MVEQEHSYRGEKSAYFINPLHYRFKDIFYFQISGSEAINITSTDLILALSDNELNFTKIREILDRLNFTEKTFEILLQKKIIIPAELYPKTIITILEQFEQNLYTSDYSNSINSIFPYSESYGYRIVSVIKAALSLNKTFVLDRISDSGMCVKFKNGYVYNIISENCFNEDPVSIQITKSKSLSALSMRCASKPCSDTDLSTRFMATKTCSGFMPLQRFTSTNWRALDISACILVSISLSLRSSPRTSELLSAMALRWRYALLSSKHSQESVQIISRSGIADRSICRWRILISMLAADRTEMLVGATL